MDKKIVDEISSSFCSAVWVQSTIYLHNGYTHSCCYTPIHQVDLKEIADDPSALHNTKLKKINRKLMKKGLRPGGCEYCWEVEDSKTSDLSERYQKTLDADWSLPYLKEIVSLDSSVNYNPKYLEISFSNNCNLRCMYCSPALSSSWESEIKKFGPYGDSSRTGDLDRMKAKGVLPIEKNNPYEAAFWKWWPLLRNELIYFRLTGGEPLLEQATWKILDDIIESPLPNLNLCLNSNLSVPHKTLENLIVKLQEVSSNVNEVSIVTSSDTAGEQANYIRFGFDYEQWLKNIAQILDEVPKCTVSVTITVNILSLESMGALITQLMKLKEDYSGRLGFYLSFLKHPEYLSLKIATEELRLSWFNKLREIYDLFSEKMNPTEKNGFKVFLYQLNQKRVFTEEEKMKLSVQRADFSIFVHEYDKRKGLNFLETFPNLKNFLILCDEARES